MEVFSLLDSSPIVLSYSIVDFKYWETGSYVKMQIVLIDKSVLHVREYKDDRIEESNVISLKDILKYITSCI
jgi:hypothetical protein